MKTKIFVPSFYLANKDHLLRIDRPMIIGRSEGDFVFEEDDLLSARHGMISPQLLKPSSLIWAVKTVFSSTNKKLIPIWK
ncbi:MAG: hypothetical protein NDI69_05515 [Bacteriovoracaceae bacterium]|nr:hypothetical protein [Bacteriovoracaceae bacterium]